MNGHYQIVIREVVAKAMSRLPKSRRDQIQKKIDALASDPRPHGCTKLVGYDNWWRIRVGDYRVVYEIYDDRRIVVILIVAHRRESYRGL